MTKIQWTDETCNPITVATGGHWCQKISEGCTHCYAEDINNGPRFSFASHLPYTGSPPPLKFDYGIPKKWARMRSPKRIFVCSMTDIFGAWVDLDWQLAVFDGAAAAPTQTIQLVTKRPDIALSASLQWLQRRNRTELPPNLWMGVSMENQKRADERLPILEKIPARIRFVSAEPLLGPVKIPGWVSWLIIGGESGKNARNCDVTWIGKMLRETPMSVKVFVKQLGSNATYHGERLGTPGDPKGGGENTLQSWGLYRREFPE